MSIPLTDVRGRYLKFKEEIDHAVRDVLANGQYIFGPNVVAFEEEAASSLGCTYTIGVASGTDALLLSLLSLGIGEGDEVITTPYTFFATAGAIARAGAKPVFVDIEENTFNLDAEKIPQALTPKTKAILPVHLFGQPAAMGPIIKIAQEHGLAVIEDACQAMGAVYQGKKVGPLGDLGCLSFFPTKNLGGMGDGGMVVTNNEKLAAKIRQLRFHGSTQKYYHELLGFNSRLDEIQAAILRIYLKYLDAENEKRRKVAALYSAYLKNTSCILPYSAPGNIHVYHLFTILHPQRDLLFSTLLKNNINCGIYYPLPLHLQKVFAYLDYRKGDFPVSEKISRNSLSLPMYPDLGENDIAKIASILQKIT